MTLPTLIDLARQYYICDENLNEIQLIRKIQLAEWHQDCFATPLAWTCPEFTCRWRKDCLRNCVKSEPEDI